MADGHGASWTQVILTSSGHGAENWPMWGLALVAAGGKQPSVLGRGSSGHGLSWTVAQGVFQWGRQGQGHRGRVSGLLEHPGLPGGKWEPRMGLGGQWDSNVGKMAAIRAGTGEQEAGPGGELLQGQSVSPPFLPLFSPSDNILLSSSSAPHTVVVGSRKPAVKTGIPPFWS